MTEEERKELESLLKSLENQTPINADVEFKIEEQSIVDEMNNKGLAKIGKEMSICKAD